MKGTIFSNAAQVDVQGNGTLQLLANRPNQKTYRVNGLRQGVIVEDYRPIPTPDDDPSRLNQPAHVTIRQGEGQEVIVQLRPTDRKRYNFTLWIAAGLDEFIPQHDCVFDRLGFLEDDTFAFLALLKRSRVS